MVSGRHADNVAPALLGGLVLVRSTEPLDVVRLPVPPNLFLAVVHPDFELPTREARAALPAQVSLKDMVYNTAQIAAFVAACHNGEAGLLGRAMEESVVTPARAALIPGAAEVMARARKEGALGSSICGAGPSIFALVHSVSRARVIGAAMQETFAAAGLQSTSFVSPADAPGAKAR